MKRLSESVWGNISKRAEGSIERKEDDIEKLGILGFVEYLQETYVNNVRSYRVKNYSNFMLIEVPLFEYHNYYAYLSLQYNDSGEITIINLSEDFYEKYGEMIEMPKLFEPYGGDKYIFHKNDSKIIPKGKYFKRRDCIEIIDVFLDNLPDKVTGPLVIKNEKI